MMTLDDEPASTARSVADLEYAHDLLKFALMMPVGGEFLRDKDERQFALLAGGVLCFALGHRHERWLSELLARIETTAIKRGVFPEQERRFQDDPNVS